MYVSITSPLILSWLLYQCVGALDVQSMSLLDASADDLAEGLSEGLFNSVDLVKAYTSRIDEVNAYFHAVTELNPDAVIIAAELDDERARGTIRGPLHGLPVLVKNNVATMDKMNNTAGSFALLGATVPKDSTVVVKLRQAGIIILGKANMSQWAGFRSSNSSNGWSAHGGQVFGAYFPGQDASGSSSGSAVSSSLGLAWATLGTETSGSIAGPSSFNNVVGIKPTVGLTSRNLVIPISEHQDAVGPIARTVKDAAYLLQAIAGADKEDNYTSAIPFDSLPNYVAACKLSSLYGKRIGIPRNAIAEVGILRSLPGVLKLIGPLLDAFDNAIEIMKDSGATIVDNTNYTAIDLYDNGNSSAIVLIADALTNIPQYLSKLVRNPNNITDLASLRRFTQSFPLEDYPNRDTDAFDQALSLGLNNTSIQVWEAYQQNLYIGGLGGILGALKNHSLDAVILPTVFSFEIPALVGTPVVTVPLGFFPGNTSRLMSPPRNDLAILGPNTPFGISFLGKAWSEADLIGYAYAFEQRTKARMKVRPFRVPTAEVRTSKVNGWDGQVNKQKG